MNVEIFWKTGHGDFAFYLMSGAHSLRFFFLASNFVYEAHDQTEQCVLCRDDQMVRPSNSSSSTASPPTSDKLFHLMTSLTAPPLDAPIVLAPVAGPSTSVFGVKLSCNGTFRVDDRCYSFCPTAVKNVTYVPASCSSVSGVNSVLSLDPQTPTNHEGHGSLSSHAMSPDDLPPTSSHYHPPSVVVEFQFVKLRLWIKNTHRNGGNDGKSIGNSVAKCVKAGHAAVEKQHELLLSEVSQKLILLFKKTSMCKSSEMLSKTRESAFEMLIRECMEKSGAGRSEKNAKILQSFEACIANWDMPDAFPYDLESIRRQRDVDVIADAFANAAASVRHIIGRSLCPEWVEQERMRFAGDDFDSNVSNSRWLLNENLRDEVFEVRCRKLHLQ